MSICNHGCKVHTAKISLFPFFGFQIFLIKTWWEINFITFMRALYYVLSLLFNFKRNLWMIPILLISVVI